MKYYYSFLSILVCIWQSIFGFLRAQSAGNLTESGQINKLIFDSVATSPAFISKSQFVEAWSAAIPYLPKPDNVSHLDVQQYPNFLNTAVMIGNIKSRTQLAMYFSQILYQSNGLSITQVLPCSKFGSSTACKQYIRTNVNNTGGYFNTDRHNSTDYFGRGYLYIEGASDFKSASQAIFGTDIIYENPSHVEIFPQLAWSVSAWNWATNVGALIGTGDAFGLSTKFLRPADCNSQPASSASTQAFNIYQKVLSVFDPSSVANSAGCTPNRK